MIYHNMFPHENLFLKKFPAPQLAEGDMGRMRVIPLELSVPETENLLFKCREHGSTVEGMLLSAANIAMSRLINEGATPLSMTFHSTHAVTLRRYVPTDMSNTLGCFISVHELALNTPADTSDQFWPLAVRATKEIHAVLDNGGLLQEYRAMLRLFSDKTVKKIMANKVAENEYETSNIGDYDLVFPAEDKHVKVTKVVSSTAMQDLHTPFVHYLRKFRGRFLYNLDYATNWTSTENAHKYANMTVQLMKEASRRNMCTLSSVAANLPASSFHRRIGMPSTPRVCGFIRFSRILRYVR
ncbi:uncharacterized protein LOC106180724 [Lingula anatina]|uniref:Uncharacterized protein LOC106180724 n=1 Tax=Lingula anatina TaxID=7574 RepID=A0A1S3KDC2_LINAN|nr:uncharacterized protein LOC106180724 [Lingula anatina]|eukprot:XP_013420256.1 uncharacterized protein LOC106180724 [Lingula anatina]